MRWLENLREGLACHPERLSGFLIHFKGNCIRAYCQLVSIRLTIVPVIQDELIVCMKVKKSL